MTASSPAVFDAYPEGTRVRPTALLAVVLWFVGSIDVFGGGIQAGAGIELRGREPDLYSCQAQIVVFIVCERGIAQSFQNSEGEVFYRSDTSGEDFFSADFLCRGVVAVYVRFGVPGSIS